MVQAWELYDIIYDYDENDPVATMTATSINKPPRFSRSTMNLLSELLARYASMDMSVSTEIFQPTLKPEISNVSGITLQAEPPENLSIGARANNTPELFLERQYATLRESGDHGF